MIALIVLVLSAMFEVLVMINLEKTNGFKNIKYTIFAIVAQLISVYLLSVATQTLSLNLAYATWTGLGTIGSVMYGMIVLKESKDYKKFIFMFLIISGLIGLKLTA